ncbi:hypothetical protein CXG81DRAFT_14648 [Caulochytrium protostelioides]|uniref:Serinc-domain-containing protein n=1 Tax=Caulochytrium protostelioides TaxID=1555241 RepID=A0A4P9WUR4_9FUNG|nr:Serinc-domain-containing protein [Caulochytrium protostelioides]RKO99336.1 hypothetical protein CXG81DRAFT_14648 [Caulochytrium protostelioides]|eukprot:RKO99336.1 hypothetical protein CXG81DRAFT_14648 [Caulochytrium protostelioides]
MRISTHYDCLLLHLVHGGWLDEWTDEPDGRPACFGGFGRALVATSRSATLTKIYYAIGYTLIFVLAFIFKLHAADWFPERITDDCNAACMAYLSVQRIACGLVLYHSFFAVALVYTRYAVDPRRHLHNGIWPLKLLVLAGTLTGMFFIPDARFYSWWIVALVFSCVYIVIQCFIMVDFAHVVAEYAIEQYDMRRSGGWKAALILTTFTSYAAQFAVTGVLYRFYATHGASCGTNILYLTLNLVLCLALSGLSILPAVQRANPRAGFLQAAVLTGYNTYLTASAVVNSPSECSAVALGGGSSVSMTSSTPARWAVAITGLVITILSIGYTAVSSGGIKTQSAADEDAGDTLSYDYTWMHVCFVLASFYMSCVVLNWDRLEMAPAQAINPAAMTINKGWAATWLKVGTSWFNSLLYAWSLLAPVLITSRQWY